MRSRRLLAVVMAVAWLLPYVPTHAVGFTDLDGSAYEAAIMALAGEGIISGYPDGTTRPYGRLNRVEALKVVVMARQEFSQELADTKSNMPTIALFSDVKQEAWYAPYLEVAFSHKVITGYPDNLFRPQASLRTEEALAIALRAFDIAGQPEFRTSPEIDNTPGEWFTQYVNAAIERGLLQPGSRLKIGGYISRGEFFALVHRIRSGGSAVVLSVGSSSQAQVYVPPQQNIQPVVVQQPVQQQYQPQPQPASSQAAVRRAVHTGVVDPASASRFSSSQNFAISIPSLGIVDLTVTHPADSATQKGVLAPLSTGVGHLFAYPGQGSKIMIYGHSSSYPWDLSQYTKIFRTINKIAVGERIYVTYDGKLYVYEVVAKQTVAVKDTSYTDPDENGEELILYTCWPPDTIDSRYLVRAMPIDLVALR